jgi:hypothetical protein
LNWAAAVDEIVRRHGFAVDNGVRTGVRELRVHFQIRFAVKQNAMAERLRRLLLRL